MVDAIYPISVEVSKVIGPPQGEWTYADWEKIPENDNIYEVIEGFLYMATAPSLFHNSILLQLYDYVGYPARQQGLAHVFTDGVGVLMPGCEPVRPDFVIVLPKNASILFDRRIRGVPDLIIEILSPSNADYDEGTKRDAYANAGVPEYGVIDPQKRQLRLYPLDADGKYPPPKVFNASDTVAFKCLPTIPFVVGKLFEGAPDTTL